MQQISSIMPSINLEEGIRLCGSQAGLYHRLLSHFPADLSMTRLEESITHGDAHTAFRHAHTLKGLCAQLALPALYEDACILCDLLRTSNPQTLQKAQQILPILKADYQAVLREIQLLTNKHLP